MRYVMLINGDETKWRDGGEKADVVMREIRTWVAKWAADGKIGEGGALLDSKRTAKTISAGPDGQPLVTDGPYLELKEAIGGFINLIADDLDEAVAIAATWPAIAPFEEKVEVRPVVET